MLEIENLRVSLTKNGYLKIATLVELHPSNEILDHVRESHAGVNLIASQVANILCADGGIVPAFWDDIRTHDRQTIRVFTFVAIAFSHHRLIQAFLESGGGEGHGTIMRTDLPEKEYTNLVFAMAEVRACFYDRGADQVAYDLRQLPSELAEVGPIVGELFRAKLRRCGWRDPETFTVSRDRPLAQECVAQRFHAVLGMPRQRFMDWIAGRPRQPR